MDIGGNFIKSGICNEEGEIIKTFQPKATPQEKNSFLEVFDRVISEVLAAQGSRNIKGVALSHAGIVDNKNGLSVFNGSLPFLKGYNYRNRIKSRFSLPMSIINDGQAAALAEAEQGALKDIKNGACLILGTGLALGIIIDGKIYQGANNIPGEVSFVLSTFDSPPLVRTAGVFSFIRPANQLLGNSDINDARPVFEHLRNNPHPEVERLFIQYAQVIAALVYNLHLILDLERIAIGGGISNEVIFIDELRKQYQYLYDNHPSFVFREEIFAPTELKVCEFRSESNLKGAYYYFTENNEE